MNFISRLTSLIPNSRATMRRETEAAVAKATADVTMTLENKFSNYVQMLRFPSERLPQPQHFTGNEGFSVLPSYERIRSVAETRHQELNNSNVRAWLNAFCTNGIGETGGLPCFSTSDKEWNRKANMLVGRILRDVDYRVPRIHLNVWLQMALRRMITDGDILAVSDSIITGPGKILSFESDQLATVGNATTAFARDGWTYKGLDGTDKPLLQTSGVLHDNFGKVHGYAVSNERGATEVSYDNCTIFDTEQATLLYQYERAGQYRGNSWLISALLTAAQMSDLIQSELKSAKAQATNAVLVKEKSTMAQKMMSLGLSQQQTADATGGAASQLITPIQPQHYELLEEQAGAAIIHVPADGTEFQHLKNERPSKGITDWDVYTKVSGGASLGLWKMFSTGETSASFSACKAEMAMTWAAFRMIQKGLERGVLSWYYDKVITHLIKTKQLPPCPDEKLPYETYQIRWTKPPLLQPAQEIDAILKAIKGGMTSWSKEMGPEIEEVWEQLRTDLEYLRNNKMDDLSYFETASGVPVAEVGTEPDNGDSPDDTTEPPNAKDDKP